MFWINNFDLFTFGFAIAAIVILGFVVYFNNQKSTTNRNFLILSLITASWGALNYLSYIFTGDIVLWLLRFIVFFAIWQDVFLLRFFYIFPNEEKKIPSIIKYFILPWSIFVSILIFTNLIFARIAEFSPEGKVLKVENGPGIALFGITVIGLIFSSIVLIIRKFIKAAGALKKQLGYLLIGTAITFFCYLIFNFILPAFFDNPSFIPYSAIFTLPFIAFASYAIIKHHLLNIKIVGTEILVFFLSVLVFLEVLLSQSAIELIFRLSVFILLLIFSVALIKSVINEVKTREQIQTLAKKLEKANEKLKQLDMFKSEFLSIASHQLRTPLTILKGYTSLAKEGNFGEFTEKQKGMIEKLSVSTERLIALVEDLLDISRLEKGKVEYNFQIKNIEPLVEEIYNELKPKAIAKGLEITFKKPEQLLPKVRIDSSKMHEVIFNIVDNAIKYTEKGGVVIELKKIDSAITIDVTDTGIGITPEELASLFQKFVRGTRVSQLYTEGTGLGLYYAKRVTEDHQGRISASSPGPGKGSTFHIELPIVKD